ncbi:hypothetical protein ACIQJX_35165 [Streptomyces griseoviridis]
MSASSQTPGPMPPDLPVRQVRPAGASDAFATFGVAVPAPAGPEAAEQTPVTTLRAAAAVMDAEMAQHDGAATGEQLAQAELRAGVLFDAAHVQDAVTAAVEQARAEMRAELHQLRTELAAMAGSRRQVAAVRRLVEGRRGDDLLFASVVALASEYGTTAEDGIPMTVTWTGRATVPDAHTTRRRVALDLVSSHGQRVDLVVARGDRRRLADLLAAEARDIHATCTTPGCGALPSAGDYERLPAGWAWLEVIGADCVAHWYCSPGCVADAMERAGEAIRAADQAAAVDPGQPDAWPSNGGHDALCAYASGISRNCTCAPVPAAEADVADERGDVERGPEGGAR